MSNKYKKTLPVMQKSISKSVREIFFKKINRFIYAIFCKKKFVIAFILFFCFPVEQSFSVVETTEDIYRVAETNGIATAICKAIDMGMVLMIPLFGTMTVILGYNCFQGNLKWSVFFTFGIGVAGFKGAENILNFIMPNMGLKSGCRCAIQRDIRDENGIIKTLPTGLNYDCTEGLDDYNNENKS